MKITDQQQELFAKKNRTLDHQSIAIRVLCILYELTTRTTRPDYPDLHETLATLKGYQLIKNISVGGTATVILTDEGIRTARNFIADHKKAHNKLMAALLD